MNVKNSRLTLSIFAIALLTTVMNDAQAAALLKSEVLSQASNLLEEKKKVRKTKKAIKPTIKKKTPYKKSIRTCDSYSSKILHKKAAKYKADINRLAKQHKVSPHLIMAVITVESCFRPSARSPQGAAGLMQLIPATASRFGTDDRYNPRDNIQAGTRYLKFLLKRFNGDLKLVAAAYNAGEGAVSRYKGIPPYKETRAYVAKVLNAYNKLAKATVTHSRMTAKKVRKTLPIKSVRLIQTKQRIPRHNAKRLAFTIPEWKQITNILNTENNKAKLRHKQLL